jgi:flagellar protein FlgJ
MTNIAFKCGKSTVSINPVSDIVLDVARAADPAKSWVAAQKLSRAEAPDQASSSGFDNVLSNAATTLRASRNSLGGGGTKSSEILPRMDARSKAYKGLEQLILKNLVESMLPKESEAFFGTGSAGDIWRSFLADQLATQVGKTVDLGIFHQSTAAPNSLASRTPVHNRVQVIPHIGPSLYGWS